MELFIVLVLFGVMFYAIEKILLRSVRLFEGRENFSTTGKIINVEYKKAQGTTIYYVEFKDNEDIVQKGKSLQYKGNPRYKLGEIVDIDYLIRDEMDILIESKLVDVKHPEHKSMYEALQKPLGFLKIIAYIFFIASAFALIIKLIN